jgi:hypothetical protein
MRVLVTGDRRWYAPDLAVRVVNRLLVRYGPGLVIVHGAAEGIDRSFAEACFALGVEQEAHRHSSRSFPASASSTVANSIRFSAFMTVPGSRSPEKAAKCLRREVRGIRLW